MGIDEVTDIRVALVSNPPEGVDALVFGEEGLDRAEGFVVT
jgi:hypothetical protein